MWTKQIPDRSQRGKTSQRKTSDPIIPNWQKPERLVEWELHPHVAVNGKLSCWFILSSPGPGEDLMWRRRQAAGVHPVIKLQRCRFARHEIFMDNWILGRLMCISFTESQSEWQTPANRGPVCCTSLKLVVEPTWFLDGERSLDPHKNRFCRFFCFCALHLDQNFTITWSKKRVKHCFCCPSHKTGFI